MRRTRIKICGIGRVEDALAAARVGADAIGMVFQPGAGRYVAPARAREIMQALPPFVSPVGLFVDAPVEQVREVAGSLGLRHIQLHGHETANDVEALREFVVLKAIRVDRSTFAEELSGWREAMKNGGIENLRGIILETAAAAPGGTGMANDWPFIRECQAAGLFEGMPALIVAGALMPGNVGGVVRALRPWAVDVSSGVESSRGVKSEGKIVEFVNAVRDADVSGE